jgi:hypothetical protein
MQQTPSTQWFVVHWVFAVHGAPCPYSSLSDVPMCSSGVTCVPHPMKHEATTAMEIPKTLRLMVIGRIVNRGANGRGTVP